MSDEQIVSPLAIARFMERIDTRLEEILRRLDEGTRKMREHDDAIRKQELFCQECRAKMEAGLKTANENIEAICDREKTLNASVRRVQDASQQAKGASRAWSVVAMVLSLLLSAIAIFWRTKL